MHNLQMALGVAIAKLLNFTLVVPYIYPDYPTPERAPFSYLYDEDRVQKAFLQFGVKIIFNLPEDVTVIDAKYPKPLNLPQFVNLKPRYGMRAWIRKNNDTLRLDLHRMAIYLHQPFLIVLPQEFREMQSAILLQLSLSYAPWLHKLLSEWTHLPTLPIIEAQNSTYAFDLCLHLRLESDMVLHIQTKFRNDTCNTTYHTDFERLYPHNNTSIYVAVGEHNSKIDAELRYLSARAKTIKEKNAFFTDEKVLPRGREVNYSVDISFNAAHHLFTYHIIDSCMK